MAALAIVVMETVLFLTVRKEALINPTQEMAL
jgi:hypothetical protein